MSSNPSNIIDQYKPRASTYDEANGGWHIELGLDFVRELDPQPGESALDLACGTGLVTIPLAEKVGPTGVVVGVDLTAEMINIGREKVGSALGKPAGNGMAKAPIDWIVEDITNPVLLEAPAIKRVLDERGGFDIISVCSAFILLPDQASALTFWTRRLLRKGGRIILDVPTEDLTSQYMFTHHLPRAVGLPPYMSEGRTWVQSMHSVQEMFEKAGLQAENCRRTKSYLGETWYAGDDDTALNLFDEASQKYKFFQDYEKQGKREEAKKAWLNLWKQALRKRDDGSVGFLDGHWLYVCSGRKPSRPR